MARADGSGRRSQTLVGRTREQTLIEHLTDEMSDGRPSFVVVSGVPGSGKTSLWNWAAEHLAETGAVVLRASCSASDPPLTTLTRLLHPLGDLARSVRTPREDADVGPLGREPPDNDLALLVADDLVARARRRPLALLLDDVHDLEQVSLDVIEQVITIIDDAAVRSATQFLALFTVREPIGRGGLVDRVVRLEPTRVMTIDGLDEHDVFELMAARRLPRDPTTVAGIVEDSGGLPLLVEVALDEIAAQATGAGGSLTDRRADLRVRTIADATRQSLRRVGDSTRSLLQSAAIVGQRFHPDELAGITATSRSEIDQQLDGAILARLVVRDGAELRFAHPLVRTQVLADLSARSHRDAHLRAAEWFEHSRDGSADPAERDELRVRHADQLTRAGLAGLSRDQIDAVHEAGSVAWRGNAWHVASRFFRAAAQASIGVGSDDEAARRHLAAGRAAYFDHDGEVAEAMLGAAVIAAQRSGSADLCLAAALTLVWVRLGSGAVGPGAVIETGELDLALQGAVTDEALVIEGRAALVEALFVSSRHDQAEAIIDSVPAWEPGADEDRPLAVEYARGRMVFAEGLHHLAVLELTEAERCFRRAADHATFAGDALAEITARSRAALVRVLRGDVDHAATELAELVERARRHRYWAEASFAASQLALVRSLGPRDELVASAEDANRLFGRFGHRYVATLLVPVLAAVQAREGRTDEAGGDLAIGPRGRVPSVVRVLMAVEANDVDATRDALASAGWRSGLRGSATLNTLALPAALVEAGDLLHDEQLVQAGRIGLQSAADAGVVIAVGWPTTVPRLLAVAARWAGEWDDADRQIRHAIGLSERQGLVVERAKAFVELARLRASTEGPAAEGSIDEGPVGEGPVGEGPADEVASLLLAAAREFEQQHMLGWACRVESIAEDLGRAAVLSAASKGQKRTILTTDIVGSTEANARLGDALYLEQLRIHDRIVRQRMREFQGVEIKHTGDGFNAWFRGPGDGLRCALEVQEDFVRWRQDEPELGMAIRCGLAVGTLLPSGGDLHGLVQSEAARLCALAGPGEVLVSDAVITTDGTAGVLVEERGSVVLRGLPRPTRVYRVRRP